MKSARVRSSFPRAGSALVAALLLTGCATYQATAYEDMEVGSSVRLQLSRQAFADLPQISDRTGRQFSGTVVSRTPQAVRIHVPLEMGSLLGQDIDVPSSGVVLAETRHVDKARTFLAVGAGVGVIVAALVGTNTGKQITANNPDEQPPGEEGFTGGPIARAILLSIPLW